MFRIFQMITARKKKSQYIKWFNKDHPFKSEEVVI